MHQNMNKLRNITYASSLVKRVLTISVIISALLATGCGVRHQQVVNNDDYVEIDNPLAGNSPHETATVWVPRKSVERGIPRGRDLAKQGYEKIAGKPVESSAFIDAGKPPAGVLRKRLLIAEAGEQKVGVPLKKFLTQHYVVKSVPTAGSKDLLSDQEQLDYIAKIAELTYGGPILFISKPEGVQPGARLKADLYDIRGPLVIRSFWVAVPKPSQGQSVEDALFSALKGVADATQSSLQWSPWYGRVVSVGSGRIYIDAGSESGIKVGQKLFVYRGGETVKGIGFAPGERIASFTITELIGQDGAYGLLPGTDIVKPGDYIELEK